MLLAFREALQSIEPADEPWFRDQYHAFLGSDDEDFVLADALKCLALMYWKGMDDAFTNIIREQIGVTSILLETDADWIRAYHEHILGNSSVFGTSEVLGTGAPYVRAMSMGIYFTTTISESGTSETGKIITLGDVGLNDVFTGAMRATISFAELIKFTTSRLPNLPALKNLGILQVQNASLLCWVPMRCVITPFRTKQLAQSHSEDHNNVHALIGDLQTLAYVICMRDAIVKITPDQRVYSKVKKTYYTIVHYPEYLQPAIINYNNPLQLPILLVERILDLHGKYSIGVTARGTFTPMMWKSNDRRTFKTMPVSVREWFRNLKNSEMINSNPKWRVNYDCLATEFL